MPVSRDASSRTSNTLTRLSSSPGVSRSAGSVPRPAWFSAAATNRLRGAAPAAAAAVREDDRPGGPVRDGRVPGQFHVTGRHGDLPLESRRIRRRGHGRVSRSRRRAAAVRSGGSPVQQGDDLFVAGLGELRVPLADRGEHLGGVQARHLIGVTAQRRDDLGRRYRHGRHDPFRALRPLDPARGPGRGPGRDAVVHHDRGTAAQRYPRAACPEPPDPAVKFRSLSRVHGADLGGDAPSRRYGQAL